MAGSDSKKAVSRSLGLVLAALGLGKLAVQVQQEADYPVRALAVLHEPFASIGAGQNV